jgi:single-stranded-DNA-specific exonuclease
LSAKHDSCISYKNIKIPVTLKKLGEDNAHLKLFVKQIILKVFRRTVGKQNGINYKSEAFEAVYCIDENEWNGKVSIQLRLKN